jgi:AGCS family alanine or glycine:cation symporter
MLALKDYETQLNNGQEPVFDPHKLGIEKADFWVNK